MNSLGWAATLATFLALAVLPPAPPIIFFALFLSAFACLGFAVSPPPPKVLQISACVRLTLALLAWKMAVTHSSPFAYGALEGGGWAVLCVLGLNAFYLRASLHHARAHQKLLEEWPATLREKLRTIRVDAPLFTPEETERAHALWVARDASLRPLLAIGSGAGEEAVLLLWLLAVGGVFAGESSFLVGWTLCIPSASFLTAVAQDRAVRALLPGQSLLC